MNFPKHAASLTLEHNDHKGIYFTAEQQIEAWERHNCPPRWKNDESKKRAMETDEIWTLQWYPDNPTGSYCVAAPTLDEVLEFARDPMFREAE